MEVWLNRIGQHIKTHRGKENQAEYAKRVGISQRTLSDIETGTIGPTGYGVDKLFKALSGLNGLHPEHVFLKIAIPEASDSQLRLHEKLQFVLDNGEEKRIAPLESLIDDAYLISGGPSDENAKS